MRVTTVVLNWRRPHHTVKCVVSLLDSSIRSDIVVVDNRSMDGSLTTILAGIESAVAARSKEVFVTTSMDDAKRWKHEHPEELYVMVCCSGRNGGYAYGNNFGMRVAAEVSTPEFYWILNNDTLVESPYALSLLLERMDIVPEVGLCGSTVVYEDDREKVQSRGGGRFNRLSGSCNLLGRGEGLTAPVDDDEVSRVLDYINGAAVLVRAAYVESIGFMTEDYFLYFEELDWAFRGRGKFKLCYVSRSVVTHSVGASIGTTDDGDSSRMARFYLTRNWIKFVRRHWAFVLPVVYSKLIFEIARDLKRGRKASAAVTTAAMFGLRPHKLSAPH